MWLRASPPREFPVRSWVPASSSRRCKKRLELTLPFVITSIFTGVLLNDFFNAERACLTVSMVSPRVCPALVPLFLKKLQNFFLLCVLCWPAPTNNQIWRTSSSLFLRHLITSAFKFLLLSRTMRKPKRNSVHGCEISYNRACTRENSYRNSSFTCAVCHF